MANSYEKVVLGAGCFWCTEAVLADVEGIEKITVGYAGGATDDPTYQEVYTGTTGHAEVALVEFDPEKVTLEKILDLFFAIHDPTSLNRQGGDTGTQYRSIILFESREQRETVDRFIREAAKNFDRPIVTEVGPLETFYPAEEYHQKYFEKNPRQPYCSTVISPKVEKVRRKLGRVPS